MNYAKVGLGIHARSHAKASGYGQPARAGSAVRREYQSVTVGWTTPSLIYDKMRQIQASAASLDADVAANVERQAFKDSWKGWYDAWKAFYERTMSGWAKATAWMSSDELNGQVESYRAQLVSWFEAYSREKKGDQPVPPPNGQPPTPVKPPQPGSEPDDGFTVPWWGWMLGGVAVVGLGYWAYRSATAMKREVEAKDRAIREHVLPAVLGSQMGPVGVQFAHAAAARDPLYPPMGYYPPLR